MPRINIEDSIHIDDRYLDLVKLLSSKEAAMGALVYAWLRAQKHWKEGELIPIKDWENRVACHRELEKVGLAERHPDGVYVVGSKKNFAWLVQCSNAGKSKSPKKIESIARARAARAEKRDRERRESEILNGRSEKHTKTLNGTERTLNPSEPLLFSSSPPLFSSPLSSENEEGNLPRGSAPRTTHRAPKDPTPSTETWEAYRAAYFRRYEVEPVRNASVNGMLSNFVKRIAREEAPKVAEFFVNHSDSFYVKNQHSVGLMLKDAESLRTQWARGRAVTMDDARSVERRQSNFNSFAKHLSPQEN